MRLFKCQSCGQLLYFENTTCERCGRRLGFLSGRLTLSTLEPEADDAWRALALKSGLFRLCANAEHDACNWLVPVESEDKFCQACSHNRTVPDLTDPTNLKLWRRLELGKHRLFYTLDRLRLPTDADADIPPLTFDFLAPAAPGQAVMTGHDNGLITIALSEADDAAREQARSAMSEPYRTPLGHFRHESGHYFWDRLVKRGGRLEECRALFGDDTQDYDAALQTHYANGAPPDWQQRFVSHYASSHPWEDFAETWAHYLHITDTMDTARAFGLSVHPAIDRTGDLHADLDTDSRRAADIDEIMADWLPLAFAVNSLNRAMDQPDLYPFVLSQPTIAKLGFIHRLVTGHDAKAAE
jgi:hypothetical protein